MRLAIIFALVCVVISGCAGRKVVVKNCEKAGNAEYYVCDAL